MNETVLLSLPLDSLRSLITEAVTVALDARTPPASEPPPNPDLLSRHEAAKRLHVSLPTLQAMNRRGTLRPMRVAGVRRVLYKAQDVEAALQGRGKR